jgi:hypothetical protein
MVRSETRTIHVELDDSATLRKLALSVDPADGKVRSLLDGKAVNFRDAEAVLSMISIVVSLAGAAVPVAKVMRPVAEKIVQALRERIHKLGKTQYISVVAGTRKWECRVDPSDSSTELAPSDEPPDLDVDSLTTLLSSATQDPVVRLKSP